MLKHLEFVFDFDTWRHYFAIGNKTLRYQFSSKCLQITLYYENLSTQYSFIFLIFAQNKDCGYTLEPPRRCSFNEYPQSMFWSKNKKDRYTPAYPSFAILKWGIMGVYITRTCNRNAICYNTR